MFHTERQSSQPPVEPLTGREREVLALLAKGYSAREIAARLTLAISSVKWHIQHVYAKLGVNSKRQAITRAEALGLLGTGQPESSPQPTPAPAGKPAPRHNLPLQVSRFIGRETEIAQLQLRLAEHRLVTLTGPGGVGKTRLALRTAEELHGQYSGGAWLVELAPLSNPRLVPQQVAAALGLRDEPGRPALDTLADFLREQQILLVLDNCEHLLDGSASLCAALLRTALGLSILACSREPLQVAGEFNFGVPSLPFPEEGLSLTPAEIAEYGAVRLFIDRAGLVQPQYRAAAHNAQAIARICQRVDGIPLAIEMAAARINTLSAEQIAHRLQDSLRLLSGGSRTAAPRHQTLRAMIDWSYALLQEEERLLLQRLTIFAGGCTLEAAEAVCAGDGAPAASILDLLASLVAKSMVVVERPAGQAPRYSLLEIIRQYAREKLEAAGDSARLNSRHRDFFLAYAEGIFPGSAVRAAQRWAQKMQADRDNMRQALAWSFSDLGLGANAEAGLRLVIAITKDCDVGDELWTSHEEHIGWYDRSIALCRTRADISPQLHARILVGAAHIYMINDPHTARALSQEAAAISRNLGPEGVLLESLCELSIAHMILGEIEQAMAVSAESETVIQALERDLAPLGPNLETMAKMAQGRAGLAAAQGRHKDAKRHANESIQFQIAAGNPLSSYYPRLMLGHACLALNEYDEAYNHYIKAQGLADEWGSVWAMADSRYCVSAADFRRGNLEAALDCCRDSLRLAAGLPDYNIVAHCLGLAAGIAAQQRQPHRAAQLSGAAQAMYLRQGRKPWDEWSLDALLCGWREAPEAAAIQAAYDAGQAMSSDDAIAYALTENEA